MKKNMNIGQLTQEHPLAKIVLALLKVNLDLTPCQHSYDLTITKKILTSLGFDVKRSIQWLSHNGAGCDCRASSVLNNLCS